MYILFEELSDYEGKILNIILASDNLSSLMSIINDEHVIDMTTFNDVIKYTPKNNIINDMDRTLILVRKVINENKKVMVSA